MDDDSQELGGVTWSELGKLIYITASVFFGVFLLVFVWDFIVSRRAANGRRDSVRMALIQPSKKPPWRLRIGRAWHPTRSRKGRIFELVNMCISIFQLFQYFVRTYNVSAETSTPALVTACFFNAFFIIRYALRLFSAEPGSRLKYVTGFIAIIDIVTIVSALLPEIGIISTFLTFTYLRAIIIVHNYGNLDFWLTPQAIFNRVTAQLVRIGAHALTFLIVMGCSVMTLERAGNPEGFDTLVATGNVFTLWNALYWALVTLATVGYGDIAPVSALGRAATFAFIAAGVIAASGLFSTILDLVLLRRQGMDSYSNWRKKMLVILTGNTDRGQLLDILQDLFPPDQADLPQHLHVVALLDEQVYNHTDRQFFIGHPYYRLIFSYLQGSVFSWSDLTRAGAALAEAQAMFILADKGGGSDDNENILRLVAVRRLVPSLPVYIMLRSRKNAEYAVACGVDAANILFMDVCRFGLIGMNAIAPGAAALFINAISNQMSQNTINAAIQSAQCAKKWRENGMVAKPGTETHRRVKTPKLGKPSSQPSGRQQSGMRALGSSIYMIFNHAFGSDTEALEADDVDCSVTNIPCMESEYGTGLQQTIHQFKCPDWLRGLTLREATIALFCVRMVWQFPNFTSLYSLHKSMMEIILDEFETSAHLTASHSPVLIAVETQKSGGEQEMSAQDVPTAGHIIFDLTSSHKLEQTDNIFVLMGTMERTPSSKEMNEWGFPRLVRALLREYSRNRSTSQAGSIESHTTAGSQAKGTDHVAGATDETRERWKKIQDVSAFLSLHDEAQPESLINPSKESNDLGRRSSRLTGVIDRLHHSAPGHKPRAKSESFAFSPSVFGETPPTASQKHRYRGKAMHFTQLNFDPTVYSPMQYDKHIVIMCYGDYGELEASLLPMLYGYGVSCIVILMASNEKDSPKAFKARPRHHKRGHDETPSKLLHVLTVDLTDPTVFRRACVSNALRLLILSEGNGLGEGNHGIAANAGTATTGVGDMRSRDLESLKSFASTPLDLIRLRDALVDSKTILATLLAEHYLSRATGKTLAGTVAELSNGSSVLFLGYRYLHSRGKQEQTRSREAWQQVRRITATAAKLETANQVENNQPFESKAEPAAGTPAIPKSPSYTTSPSDSKYDTGESDNELATEAASMYERWRIRFGLRWSLRYAAGRLIPLSAANSLLCHGFYNPSSLRLFHQILQGQNVHFRHMRIPTDILEAASDRRKQLAKPAPRADGVEELCSFAFLYLQVLLRYGIAVVGIYRNRQWMSASLPYVQTNPAIQSAVRPGDVLFVLLPAAKEEVVAEYLV